MAYTIAAPIALGLTPPVSAYLVDHALLTADKTSFVFFGELLAFGLVLGALVRGAVSEFSGPRIGFVDRALGALLGAVRIFLLAVLVVLIFAHIIPTGREPSWLADSKLRPVLDAAGEKGLRALPPDIEAYIDRLKKERGL